MSDRLHQYVDGRWIGGEGQFRRNPNPSNPTQVVSNYAMASAAEVERALAAGGAAAPGWRRTPMHARAKVLHRTADLIERDNEVLARIIAREQGKPIVTARGEVTRAADIFRYFSHDADTPTGEVFASPREGERILTERVPLGQVLCITPWNVPLAIPSWKIAPALAHGNTVLWKPSLVTPSIAVRLVRLLEEAGLPGGVLNLVFADDTHTEKALSDPRIAGCTFTGSTRVGQHLRTVGAMHGVDVLAEMGGKNGAIVLGDADLDWAARQITSAAMEWSGQRCTATSRVIVERDVADDLAARLEAAVSGLAVGDALSEDTVVGPVATQAQFESIGALVAQGLEQGGSAVRGGVPQRPEDGGYFVAPTLMSGVASDNVLFTEEVFGPVVALVPVDGADTAFELANQGRYGLSGSVFTGSVQRALDAVDRFDVGILHVNSESTGADPHVPFGGFGDSGTHHKEMGHLARDFFTRTKTVYFRGGAR